MAHHVVSLDGHQRYCGSTGGLQRLVMGACAMWAKDRDGLEAATVEMTYGWIQA